MGDYRETKRKYRKKQYEVDKMLSDLYHGIGGHPGESFSTFKKRVQTKLK